ncbi:GNAT family N-acetyltransferase [Ruminococcus sp.]|uniref:GNAT family N-acetyltransferase n=1 Tax=Ruminococcus sp. TaxID=41978 RepID=UPI0025CD7EC1|nr:GNAT family N-acetyltransferase [Ruminococcus sp.]MBQ8967006.1 GNAT family N-acetyltransferase [Ruminococcus sp.]
MTIIVYDDSYKAALIEMVSASRIAMGLDGAVREDMYDIKANYLDKGDMFFLGVDEKGGLLGCLGYSRTEVPTEAFLHRFYVKAERKRRGIGTTLLKYAEEHMRGNGILISKVHLGGDEKVWHESYSFYPKHGYVLYAPGYMKKYL